MKRQSCLKEFARYGAFNVLGMLGISCYILADTVFISRGVGTDGLTALNLAIPVYSLMHGCGMMVGMGGATRYAIWKGQKAHEQTNRLFTGTVYGGLLLAVLFMLAGGFFAEGLSRLMGADSVVFGMTSTYIRVILLFAPAFLMNDILICFVRNDGNPRLSMLAMVGGSLFNIVFDYLFIFPMGLGIFGAVLATGVSPVISLLILSGHLRKKTCGFCLRPAQPDFKGAFLAAVLGIPSFITEISSGIVILVFNSVILKLQGNVGVAAYGVIANLSLVVVSVFTGIAQGMQPLISRAYGKNDKKMPGQVLRYGLLTAAFLSAAIYLLVFLFAEQITEVFNSEGNRELQEIAATGLRLYFTGILFAGFNIILSIFFSSLEKAVPAQAISLLRGLALMIPMALLLPAFFGIRGVWLSFPVTEGVVALLGSLLLLYEKRKRIPFQV